MIVEETKHRCNEVSEKVIGGAIEVHRQLGPGLLESAYELCLCRELEIRTVPVQRQLSVSVFNKGLEIENAHRMDLLVDDLVIVELKAVERVDGIHEAQLLTQSKFTQKWLGLLINFNVPVLKNSIKRLVLG